MKLTTVERERITDSMLKIQAARATLDEVDDGKIRNSGEIDECLKTADKNLKAALGYAKSSTGAAEQEEDDSPTERNSQ